MDFTLVISLALIAIIKAYEIYLEINDKGKHSKESIILDCLIIILLCINLICREFM